jgi:hypothetical protein
MRLRKTPLLVRHGPRRRPRAKVGGIVALALLAALAHVLTGPAHEAAAVCGRQRSLRQRPVDTLALAADDAAAPVAAALARLRERRQSQYVACKF